jgi:hypothetical protein
MANIDQQARALCGAGTAEPHEGHSHLCDIDASERHSEHLCRTPGCGRVWMDCDGDETWVSDEGESA